MGCGFRDEYRGKSTLVVERDMGGPEANTCPQYFMHDPDVIHVWENLEDFERGTLGPIWQLSAVFVDYLRTLAAARNEWRRANDLV